MNEAGPQIIAVVENEVGVPFQLDGQGRSLLARQSEVWRTSLGLRRSPFDYTDGVLTARDVTGFVSLGNVVVEVVPKFLARSSVEPELWRVALWAILARVYRLPVVGSLVPGDVVVGNHLPDLLGHVLLGSLRASRPNGRPVGYVTEQDNLQSLRGRLDVGRIMDALVHPGTIPCEYDAYSEDIPVNRLLRWSAEQLATRVRSVPLGHDLMEEAMALSGVSSFPPSRIDAERITLAPHHALLQPAVTVGQLLLAGRGLQHGIGIQELPGFLWKSAEVFEFFVRLLVRSAVGACIPNGYVEGGRVRIGVPVGGGRELLNDPDLRLVQSRQTIAVLDAKYKTWGNVPAADDVRQVVTGAWVKDCAVGGLIYPSPMGLGREPAVWHLLGPGNPTRVWALFVDLTEMGHPNGERVLVDRLAGDLMTIFSDVAV